MRLTIRSVSSAVSALVELLLRRRFLIFMTKRITRSDIKHFKLTSPTKLEIELCEPIDPAFFDLLFDLHISGASSNSARAAVAGGKSIAVLKTDTDTDLQ